MVAAKVFNLRLYCYDSLSLELLKDGDLYFYDFFF